MVMRNKSHLEKPVDFSDYEWLRPPVEEYYDPTGGLPVGPAVGDRYISDGTAGGWTDGYIYEWDGSSWVEEVPVEGWMVWLIFELAYWVFFSGGWMEVGSGTYVPYTGATGAVDLGSENLTTTGTIGDGTYNPSVEELATFPIGITLDGGGSAIPIGAKAFVTIPTNCTLVEWYMSCDVSATVVMDVWAAAGAIPDNTDTITNGHEPTITTGTVAVDTDITDWSTGITRVEGDVVRFNLDQNDNATFINLQIRAVKT